MKIGYFTSPAAKSVMVVVNYEAYTAHIMAQGFSAVPALTREAHASEIVAYEERTQSVPAWIYTYDQYNDLISDEVYSGASESHLHAVLRLTLRVLDSSPQPSKPIAV